MNDSLKLCYWIQGFAEIHNSKPTNAQWKQICEKVSECSITTTSEKTGIMTPEMFVAWLQGFVELANPKSVDELRWNIIKEHLGLVFFKVTSDDGTVLDADTLEEILKNPGTGHPNGVLGGPYFNPTQNICSNTENKTFCSSMNNQPNLEIDTSEIACAVYQTDPVNENG